MRRLFAGMSALIFAVSFFSCAKNTPEPFDVSYRARSAPTVNNVSSSLEGCYTNGEYVVELICTDKKDGTCTHNLVLFTSDSGEQKFFGTVSGNLEGGETAVAENFGEELSSVKITAKPDSSALEICYTYNGTEVLSACGEYTYLNEFWTPKEEEDRVYIREGVYYNGEYKLTVSENGSTMRFVIIDGDNRIVCEGMQKAESSVQSVSLDNKGDPVEIAAGISEGKLYMEVAVYSESDECKYAGIYKTFE